RREGVYGGTLHETRDQTAMFVPVTKAARMLAGAGEIGPAAIAAGAGALAAPTGPVYLGIPTDLLSQEAPGEPAVLPSPTRVPAPPAEAFERAAELLAGAERPLIWAGGGALRAGAGPERA